MTQSLSTKFGGREKSQKREEERSIKLTDCLASMSEISNRAEAEQRKRQHQESMLSFLTPQDCLRSKGKSLLRANALNQQSSIQTFQKIMLDQIFILSRIVSPVATNCRCNESSQVAILKRQCPIISQ